MLRVCRSSALNSICLYVDTMLPAVDAFGVCVCACNTHCPREHLPSELVGGCYCSLARWPGCTNRGKHPLRVTFFEFLQQYRILRHPPERERERERRERDTTEGVIHIYCRTVVVAAKLSGRPRACVRTRFDAHKPPQKNISLAKRTGRLVLTPRNHDAAKPSRLVLATSPGMTLDFTKEQCHATPQAHTLDVPQGGAGTPPTFFASPGGSYVEARPFWFVFLQLLSLVNLQAKFSTSRDVQ